MKRNAQCKLKISFFVLVISQTYCWHWLEAFMGTALGEGGGVAEEKGLKNVQMLVESFGYPFQAHEVISDSGYVLSLHRIPHGMRRRQNHSMQKPVALLQHGLFAATDSWLFRGPDSDLPYVLADAGYDVWLSNMRGNIYSKGHTHMDPDRDAKYWDFSMHEVAYHDYPVIFDYILNTTKQEKLFFMGHSIGSTVGLIFSSLRPEYNNKIKLHLALAPLVFVNHSITLGHKLFFLPGLPLTKTALENQIYNILPRRTSFTKMLKFFCDDGAILQSLCINLAFTVVGKDYEQLNKSYMSDFLTYYPAGTSVYLLQHTLQIFLTGKFSPFDYGNVTLNVEKYNQTHPQPYNLTRVTQPVTLHYGGGDILVPEEDVDIIERKLPNSIGKFKVPYEQFNHMDFMWGNDNKKLLFDRLVKIMDKYR